MAKKNTKAWCKSKEMAAFLIFIYNGVAYLTGTLPSVEPTPELVTAYVSAVAAIRLFFTETKLSLK